MTRRQGEQVVLHVYDLGDNTWLYPFGLGAYHSGVVAFGREFTFSRSGVFDTRPRDVPAPFRVAVPLGVFMGSSREFRDAVADVARDFAPGTYDLYRKNCNCFSDALCRRLFATGIPAWVNRSAHAP